MEERAPDLSFFFPRFKVCFSAAPLEGSQKSLMTGDMISLCEIQRGFFFYPQLLFMRSKCQKQLHSPL